MATSAEDEVEFSSSYRMSEYTVIFNAREASVRKEFSLPSVNNKDFRKSVSKNESAEHALSHLDSGVDRFFFIAVVDASLKTVVTAEAKILSEEIDEFANAFARADASAFGKSGCAFEATSFANNLEISIAEDFPCIAPSD